MTSSPAAPEPDVKDWTWTLRRTCPECAFDALSISLGDVPEVTLGYAAIIIGRLRQADARTRPAPTVWSALEYGCHVRDVCRLFERRLELMLTCDDPIFDNWDQDETALASRYWLDDPDEVADALEAASASIAAAFGAVDGAQWERPGRRSNGSTFTIDTLARYFLHDLAHHAWDVTVPDPSP